MNYHITIFFSEEDNGYIADIPDLPGYSAFGDTPEKALHELVKVKTSWLKTTRQEKIPVPPPRYRPVIYQVLP